MAMKKRIAVFPGSFDPITKGHESIVKRALPLFDEIIIGIGENIHKSYYFTLEKRKQWLKKVFKNEPKVRVESYTGLTIEFAKKMKANYILRGLRTSADFEFEIFSIKSTSDFGYLTLFFSIVFRSKSCFDFRTFM